jgi:hypothetical protein
MATTTTAPSIPNAPKWWINLPGKGYDTAANALIPFLSPENQRSVGSYLANKQTSLKSYADAPYAPTTPSTPDTSRYFMSSARAQQAMTALQNAGVTTGSGYTYLKTILSTLQRLGGNGGPITRGSYQELVNAINAINAQAKGDSSLKNYQTLADYLVNPTFSAGRQTGAATQTQTGRTIFGKPNTSLFS